MRLSAFLLFSYFVILLPIRALGLTIEVDSGAASTLPSFVHDATSSTPLSIPVTLHNESLSTTENVVAWQLMLRIESSNDATGMVEIASFETPELPFLDSFGIGTNPPGILPSREAVLFDADTPLPPSLPGKDIGPGETRRLININLFSPNNARGNFYLVLGQFDSVDGSAWSGLFPPANAYTNSPGSTLPGEIVLAEIEFVVPEPSTLCLLIVSFTTLAMRARDKFKLDSTA